MGIDSGSPCAGFLGEELDTLIQHCNTQFHITPQMVAHVVHKILLNEMGPGAALFADENGKSGDADAQEYTESFPLAMKLQTFMLPSIDEYLELASAGAARGADAKKSKESAARLQTSPSEDAAGPSADGKRLSGGEIRALRKTMASNERKIETLKGKIESTRAEMAAADPSDFVALGDFQKQLDDLQAQIDALEEEWLEAAEALGE